MRHLPTLTYSGLTIVLSNPSRHDIAVSKLLSGAAGTAFEHRCLAPELSKFNCDIRTANTLNEGLLHDTKSLLLLGTEAFQQWTKEEMYKDYNINEQRGYPLQPHSTIPCNLTTIASYQPQDAIDPTKDYEEQNKAEYFKSSDGDDKDSETTEQDEKGHKGKTSRENWFFWLGRDTKRAISRLWTGDSQGQESLEVKEPQYDVYPQADELIALLHNLRGQQVFLDIETDSDYNITVLSFSIGFDRIITVPFLRYDYRQAYLDKQHRVLQAFSSAFAEESGNTLICHNALFDLFILAWRYKLPLTNRIQDTMLMHHRVWPEVEKSLGHAMSHLTWEPYHKDEGVFNPHNVDQENRLWRYNAKDVWGTMLVWRRLWEIAQEQGAGMIASFKQANSMVRPYLINSLQGMAFDRAARQIVLDDNDRACEQYLRCIRLLVGDERYRQIAGKSDKALPMSNKQCTRYFHEVCGYKVVARSKITQKPSLDEKAMYKLKLRNAGNPVIDFCLAYRQTIKESSGLKFNEWKR